MPLSDLILIVYYPVCAGGKFTVNSLGLSRHCTLHDYKLAEWDSDQTEYSQHYYKTKLDYVLKTVPDVQDDTNWTQFEMGNSHQLFGRISFDTAAKKITKQNQYFCVLVHNREHLESVLKITNATKIIKLTNFCHWMRISSFKHQATASDIENKIAAHSFSDANEMQEESWFYTIDMDRGMQDQPFMQHQIESLYKKLGWEDFNLSAWSQYYKKYISSHSSSGRAYPW